jgi:hypothetical protein
MLRIFLWRSPGVAGGGLILVAAFLYITGFVLLFRFLLLLPARAIGDVGLSFGDAWSRSAGSGWRIFCGTMACMLPPALIFQVVFFLAIGLPAPDMFSSPTLATRMAVSGAILMPLYLLITPIAVGFLSYAYRYLVRLEAITGEPPGARS